MSLGPGNIQVNQKRVGGGGGSVTGANNGLRLEGTDVYLGGTLVDGTTIDVDGYPLRIGNGGDLYFLIDPLHGIQGLGDFDYTWNGVYFKIDQSNTRAEIFSLNLSGFLQRNGGSSGAIITKIGDVDGVKNGTYIEVDDDEQKVLITAAAGAITDDFAVFDNDQIKKIPAPVESGTYTPTITGINNLDFATPSVFQFLRVGKVVTVSGKLDIQPTNIGDSGCELSLPITNLDFTTDGEASGTGGTQVGFAANSTTTIYAITNKKKARFNILQLTYSGDSFSVYVHFTYRLID